jgi:hypothetical protein
LRAVPIALVIMLLVGCGGNQRQTTLKAMFTTLNAARDGFEKWDEVRQQQIIDAATSKEAGQAVLATFREARDKVYLAFEIGYRALAAAALSEDELTLETARKMSEQLFKEIATLQGRP